MKRVCVVGSGQTGLSAAIVLAHRGVAPTLIERLPCPGGQEPEHPRTDRLAEQAAELGVQFQLATLAVRWTGCGIIELGPHGCAERPADGLIIATGRRPSTRAELGVTGDRCAGIVPGSAARHITESGVLLGHNPIVVGATELGMSVAKLLLDAGAHTVRVVGDGSFGALLADGATAIEHARVVSAHGMPRIASVVIQAERCRLSVATDALILAADPVPMRNVEGAVTDAERRGVPIAEAFCNSDSKTLAAAQRAATEAVDALLGLGTERLRHTLETIGG